MLGVCSELILVSSGAEVRTALVITKAVKGAIEMVVFKKSGCHIPIQFLASNFDGTAGGTCKSLSHLFRQSTLPLVAMNIKTPYGYFLSTSGTLNYHHHR